MNEVCVRVAARVRPLVPREVLHRDQVCVRVVPDAPQVMVGSERLFSFDYAFGPSASQEEVYESCVQPLVRYVADGYNATVFCYGQTGSGKTYTLGGRRHDEDGGVIVRVVQDLLSLLEEKRSGDDGADITVRVSYIELYREELRDLLELPNIQKEIHIREDEKRNTVVVGAKKVLISSAEELLSILEMGNAVRQTAATGLNEHSSRSHVVLTFHINSCLNNNNNNRNNNSSSSSSKLLRSSKLCLVDLAGSERAEKTGNIGPRLKESAHINTGLLALGNVIRALSNCNRNRRGNSCGGAHIPYRDAKITRLLRDSLGGNAHTLMVACVSPSDDVVTETLSVLQFASNTRNIRNCPGASTAQSEVKLSPPPWPPTQKEELEFELQTLKELLKEKESCFSKKRETAGEQSKTSLCVRDQEKELSQYRYLVQDAAVLLANMSDPASSSLKQRLRDWQERMTAVAHSHRTDDDDDDDDEGFSVGFDEHQVNVVQLREELKKCQETLQIDEQLLQQKDAELRRLQREVEELIQERELYSQASEEDQARIRIRTEELVNQQVLIDHLRKDLLTFRGESIDQTQEAKASGYSEIRCRSVPLITHSSVNRPRRNIHSSPPVYSLERIMAAFKMRGHLLLAEMEEKDHVYTPFKTQQPESKDRKQEEDEEDNDGLTGQSRFRHSLNQTWTSQQKEMFLKGPQIDPDQTFDGNPVIIPPGQSSAEKETLQLIQNSIKIRASKTYKGRKVLTRHGEQRCDGGENMAAATRRSLHNQPSRADVDCSLQQRKRLQSGFRQLNQKNDETETPRQKALLESGLEEEEEKVLQKRMELEELEAELNGREEVLQRREACLQQKNHLEVKMLRSSQALSQDVLRVSMQLESVEKQLHGSRDERRSGGVTVRELEKEREMLKKQKDTLEDQLRSNGGLTVEERHSLFQLDEAIEALDAALEFKNNSIQTKRKKLSIIQSSVQQSRCNEPAQLCDVIRKLAGLSRAEALEMLVKYFNKVVYLREVERNLTVHCEELHLNAGEQHAVLEEMEVTLQRLALEADRRLTQQQRDHHNNIQLLLQKVTVDDQRVMQDKLQHLEKELFFYKSSSRQLKQKLSEVLTDAIPRQTQSSHTPERRNTRTTTHTSSHEETEEWAPASTHIATTYTKIHAEQKGRLAHSGSRGLTPLTHSSSSSPAVRKSKHTGENQRDSQCPGGWVRGPAGESEVVRPIHESHSSRTQSVVETSTDTILEDSIEVLGSN